MQTFSRIVVVLLLGVLATTLLSSTAIALPSHLPVHPAGCHHGHETPAPVPVSYQCCVAGHNVAVPGSGYTIRPLALMGIATAIGPAMFAGSASPVLTLAPRCDGSPGLTPLRV